MKEKFFCIKWLEAFYNGSGKEMEIFVFFSNKTL